MKYWVDFSASILIEAESAEEAKNEFWDAPELDLHKVEFWEVNGVELADECYQN